MSETAIAKPATASACETLARLRAGDWTPAAVAQATLAHIAQADADLGAFVCTLPAEAAAGQAAAASGPLAGLPVAVKDIFDTRDLPTRYGSALYPPEPARHDAAMVSLLRQAGALVIGKASTTEFAFLHPTATRNPRAPGHTPGGSSAGSAAAVAAGLVPLAVGTQTGGSVIRPASYCGVVGYKPSFGWLPTAGLKCFSWSLDTVGLFTRDVADMQALAAVLTGRPVGGGGAGSPSAAGAAPRAGRWRVGVPLEHPWGAVSPSALRALQAARSALLAAGVEVLSVRLPPWAAQAFAAHDAVQGWEACRCLQHELQHHAPALSPVLREYLQQAQVVSAAAYAAAQTTAGTARAAAQAWFQELDAVITPSAPDEAPAGYASTGASTFNRAWTLLGLPCVNVPGATGVQGLPMGVQVVAAYGDDARALALAALLEAALASAASAASASEAAAAPSAPSAPLPLASGGR